MSMVAPTARVVVARASYWVTESGRFGIDAYRQNRGLAIADRFQTHVYDCGALNGAPQV
jgi:hypothetical protein